MRTKLVLSGLILSIVIIGCKNQNEQENVLSRDAYEKHNEIVESTMHCYLFTNGKDSISLSYTQKNDEIDGWMNYNFFEKDGSIGEIDGKFFGDTLKLEYEFMSEGMISEQQIYFLKKDGKLYQGTGEMKSDNDSAMVYTNPNQLKYDDTTPLLHLDNCPENFIDQKDIDFYKKESEKN